MWLDKGVRWVWLEQEGWEMNCWVILVFSLDQLRQYFTQLRQETGQRLVEKVFGSEDKPSKVEFSSIAQ